MIYDIELSNIFSIKDSVVLSMEATSTNCKSQNYLEFAEGNHKCLKVGIIYGPNASGKTNILRSLDVLRRIIIHSNNIGEDQGLPFYLPFILDTNNINEPSTIAVRLLLEDEILYRYEIKFNALVILEESLSKQVDDDNILMFRREIQSNDKHYVVLEDGLKNIELSQKQIRRNQSILSYLQALNIPYVTDVALALTLKLQLANSYNNNMLNILWDDAKRLINNNVYKRRLEEFLMCLGTGVSGFRIPEKDDVFNTLTFLHRQKNGDGKYGEVSLSPFFESLGTRSLFLLGIKIIEALDKGYTLFVDELDSSFHTYITQYIINMFQDKRLNKNNAQLLMTTHDVQLMDEKTLRLDQIWLMEKKADFSSDLVSLADFNDIDESTHIAEWYMAKRFGGIPNVGSIINLFKDETE